MSILTSGISSPCHSTVSLEVSVDFVTNSNDSYWLSNPDEPLEGYLPTIGPERTARRLRTRAGLVFLQEQLEWC